MSVFVRGNVRAEEKEIGHSIQTHYKFGNEYQCIWGNREKFIFPIVMKKLRSFIYFPFNVCILIWSCVL